MSHLLVSPDVFRNRINNFGFEYLSFETRKLNSGTYLSSQRRRLGLEIFHAKPQMCVLCPAKEGFGCRDTVEVP